MVVLAALIWMVLRHDSGALWLASEAGDGGVLVPKGDLERLVSSAAGRSHADVLRAEAELWRRGGELRGRVQVVARPLADAALVGAAVEERTRRQAARLTGLELSRVDVRVRVLQVRQLLRYLP